VFRKCNREPVSYYCQIMENGMLKIALVCGLVGLVGCASNPTGQELAAANYGTEIEQSGCEARVKTVMEMYLKDPASATYKFGVCQKAGWNSVPIMGIPKQYGYELSAHINAKNSYGGYTGAKFYKFLIRDGVIIRKVQQDGAAMMPF
jgi:hypothetical protein